MVLGSEGDEEAGEADGAGPLGPEQAATASPVATSRAEAARIDNARTNCLLAIGDHFQAQTGGEQHAGQAWTHVPAAGADLRPPGRRARGPKVPLLVPALGQPDSDLSRSTVP